MLKNSLNKKKSDSRYKLWFSACIIMLLICILLLITLYTLYTEQEPPQTLLADLGLSVPTVLTSQPVDPGPIIESWNNSFEQLSYDADIVFIGDSLTRWNNFQEYFPDKKIINLGLSGDTIAGISERASVISHLNPEMIFIEGGINSLWTSSAEELAIYYESMISDIIYYNPGDEIFIQSLLPISHDSEAYGRTNSNIIKLNEMLQEIAARHGATYIDLYSLYALNGEMNPEYTTDGIHLKDEYKNLWLDALSEYISSSSDT